jgi:hypothetical protein
MEIYFAHASDTIAIWRQGLLICQLPLKKYESKVKKALENLLPTDGKIDENYYHLGLHTESKIFMIVIEYLASNTNLPVGILGVKN